ncbi:MAG TPA: cytochrome c [Puia sp.]|nr:cytochrome c [Puia sp.]
MKKLSIIFSLLVIIALVFSCSEVKRDPGRVYMPDMAYSRAYETYSVTDEQRKALLDQGIHYSNIPVEGTIKRGELMPFPFPKDAQGDSTNYVASKQFKSQIPTPDSIQMIEAERLFLVNCAICHGPKLDGNGPLYRQGEGPFPAAPANFIGGAQYKSMPEGQMFYSVAYGKNKMGSYASQLNSRQRWMVIAYIKSKQAAAASQAPATTDSTAKK